MEGVMVLLLLLAEQLNSSSMGQQGRPGVGE